MSSSQDKDRRIALSILQMERWAAKEQESQKQAEKLANTKPVKKPRVHVGVAKRIAPIEIADKFAIFMLLLGCLNASIEHHTGTDWALRFLGKAGEHIFWLVIFISTIYILGVFNDLLKTVWHFETRTDKS
jgi:hypothetical protein